MIDTPPLGRASAVAAQLPIVSAALSAAVGFFALVNLLARREAGFATPLLELGLVLVLLAVFFVTRSPRFPLTAAHPTSLLLILLLTVGVIGVARTTPDVAIGPYAALLAIFAAFVILSWPLFALAMVAALGLGLSGGAGGGRGSDFDTLTLLLSGVITATLVQYSRRRSHERARASYTALQRAQTKTAAAEARLRAVFDANPTGLIVADARTRRVLQANVSAQRMLGYAQEELRELSTGDLIEKAAVVDHVTGMESPGATPATLETDRIMRRRDGSALRAHVRAVKGEDGPGGRAWLLAHVEDVTEQRDREARLLMQSRALASIGQAVIVTDLAGRITFWNAAAERLYGWREVEVLGRHVLEVTPSSLAREEATRILAELSAGRTWQGDFELQRKDGSTFLAAVTDAPLLDAKGELVGIIGISEDVTQRRKTELALRRSERDAALGTLVAGVAHEINNPLQFMGGHLDLVSMDLEELQRLPTLEDEGKKQVAGILAELGIVRRGVDQITHITRSLRRVARQSNAPRRSEELRTLIDAVLVTARPRLGPDVDIHVVTDGHPAAVVSGEEVMQVLLNLVINACEAMGGRGRLTVRALDRGSSVILEVEDTGPGIPPDVQPHLFVPFFTTKPHGTGLGLPISRAIVEDHGGELTFETAPGRTVFRVVLPTAQHIERGKPHPHMQGA